MLNYWDAYEPQIAVDDVHHRVHLLYRSNYDGILHSIVENGAVSAPTMLDSNGSVAPHIVVDPTTGYAYAVWRQGSWHSINSVTRDWRWQTWYAYWNGTAWSGRLKKINDGDTCDSSLAVAPGGRVMLAWFQRCNQSAGNAISPGEPNVPRTAYSTGDPTQFPLRQPVSDFYTVPEKDDTLLLTYSPAKDQFYLLSEHLMWPGHSVVYRYTWKNGIWSAPTDLLNNSDFWAIPVYVGAAGSVAQIHYIYSYNSNLLLMTEIQGVLDSPVQLADYLTQRGYSAVLLGYFTDSVGGLHMAGQGTKAGVSGFYYVRP